MFDDLFGESCNVGCAAVDSGKLLMRRVVEFLHTAPEERLSKMDFVDVIRSVQGYDDSGKHKHCCEVCRTVWMHSDMCAGSEHAHMCPACGSGPFWHRFGEPGAPGEFTITSFDL